MMDTTDQSNVIGGCFPSYLPQTTTGYSHLDVPPAYSSEFEINRASNGFFVKKWGVQYVFESEKSLLSWLANELKEKNK